MSLVSAPPDGLKCRLAAEVLRDSGELRLRVTGSSMLPSLWPGDSLLIRRVRLSEVAPGDLVLFARNQRFFVHRVLKLSDDRLLTRGDSVPVADPVVGPDELLGRVQSISRDGAERYSRPLGVFGRLLASVLRRSSRFSNLLLRSRSVYRRVLGAAARGMCLAEAAWRP